MYCDVCICSSYCRFVYIYVYIHVYIQTPDIFMARLLNCQVFYFNFVGNNEIYLFYNCFVL